MKLSNKTTLFSVLALFTLILITMGTSYAFFAYTTEDASGDIIKTGTVSFYYTKTTEIGNGISLINVEMVDDFSGKELTVNTFDFTIGGDSTGNQAVSYEITATPYITNGLTEDNMLPTNNIKLYLTEVSDDTIETQTPLTMNGTDVKLFSVLKDSTDSGKTIYKGEIPAGIIGYNKKFRLRMWASYDSNSTSQEYINKTFAVKVNVVAKNVTVVAK